VWTIAGRAKAIAAAAPAATTPISALTRESTDLAMAAIANPPAQFRGRVGGMVFAVGRILKSL
jgi:hypothetical protein